LRDERADRHVAKDVEVTARPTLRERLPAQRGRALLESASVDDRLRGIRRLVVDGGEDAVATLADALAPGSAVRSHPKTRLEAIRALAAHAADDDVRKALISVLNGVRREGSESPLEKLARQTAAMALARADSEGTITPLVTAVITGGTTGEIARAALRAQPPASLAVLTRGKRALSPRVVELMGELGDIRAIPLLRRQLKRKKLRVQLAAARSLAQLGDGSVARHARSWLADPKQRAPAGATAVYVLLMLDDPAGVKALAEMLRDATDRDAALDLAGQAPSPVLVSTLAALVNAKVPQSARERALGLLGTIGDDAAAAVLVTYAEDEALGEAAVFALARVTALEASRAIAAGLSHDQLSTRRLYLRAALKRFVEQQERATGLDAALERALESADPAERAIGAFGSVLTGQRDPRLLIRSPQIEVAVAAAQATLALGPDALVACAEVLAEPAADPLLAVACGASLLGDPRGVATTELAALAEGGGPLAALAALRLAVRDPRSFRPRTEQLLLGTDPSVRIHTALGLASSPEADAVSLLVDAYRFESSGAVRRALVRALSQREETLRLATLQLAASLDPDARARALAQSALRGRRHRPRLLPKGRRVAWVTLEPAQHLPASGAEEAAVLRTGVLRCPDGLALPVVSAPDGVVFLAGLPERGELALSLDLAGALRAPRP